jgi:hypothetical protein
MTPLSWFLEFGMMTDTVKRVGAAVLTIFVAGSCDRDGTDLLPKPDSSLERVIEIGQLEVISTSSIEGLSDLDNPGEWCENEEGDLARCYYGQLSAPESASRGGATFTFEGTGDYVCIIIDPETVYWNQAIAVAGANEMYTYPDEQFDDGDVDLFAGLSSYYTGSPGIELGDFTGYYTDSLGREIEIEYGECFQRGSDLSGITTAHGGRANVEYCEVNTAEREGVEYTVLIDTFSVPLDDGDVSFATAVVGERCAQIGKPAGITECTFKGEAIDVKTGETKECTEKLEEAFCDKDSYAITRFCCANPEMCGDRAPENVCDNVAESCCENPSSCDDEEAYASCTEEGGAWNRDDFCGAHPEFCCE